MEAAFLERKLKLDPTDNHARFRLARVYDEAGRDSLAAHHYFIVAGHTDWASAHNNLAVCYAKLGFKAKQIEELQSVEDRMKLAKANVASLYASAGFLKSAREMATSVISTSSGRSDDEELAVARARGALDEGAETEAKERGSIAKIPDETKAERDFLAAFADAYCTDAPSPFHALYNTPHGDLTLDCDGKQIIGHGSFLKTMPAGGLGLIGSVFAGNTATPKVAKITLDFNARLTGLAGTFNLAIVSETSPPSTPTVLGDPSKRAIRGILRLASGTTRIDVIEEEDPRRELKTYSCIS